MAEELCLLGSVKFDVTGVPDVDIDYEIGGTTTATSVDSEAIEKFFKDRETGIEGIYRYGDLHEVDGGNGNDGSDQEGGDQDGYLPNVEGYDDRVNYFEDEDKEESKDDINYGNDFIWRESIPRTVYKDSEDQEDKNQVNVYEDKEEKNQDQSTQRTQNNLKTKPPKVNEIQQIKKNGTSKKIDKISTAHTSPRSSPTTTAFKKIGGSTQQITSSPKTFVTEKKNNQVRNGTAQENLKQENGTKGKIFCSKTSSYLLHCNFI